MQGILSGNGTESNDTVILRCKDAFGEEVRPNAGHITRGDHSSCQFLRFNIDFNGC